MEIENILKIIDKVSEKKISYFCYKEAEEKIVIKSRNENAAHMSPEIKYIEKSVQKQENNTEEREEADEKNYSKISSPIVGTFYSAASDGTEPFIKVGDTVKKGQIIGIIEAMKIMNDIESPYDGVVETINVENGQMVEYGQLICQIK